MNNSRIVSLDYLRGLAAVSIMFYHYCSWTFGKFSAGNILERVGLYGVSTPQIEYDVDIYKILYSEEVLKNKRLLMSLKAKCLC